MSGCRDWSPRSNPHNQPGRLTLIHRFGAKDIEKSLPRLIEAVRHTGQTVLWVCDPMHGNTETTVGGCKTRRFENILKEAGSGLRYPSRATARGWAACTSS